MNGSERKSPIELGREQVGKAVEVFEGFWLMATSHHPGGAQKMPEINNRCLIFRLDDRGTPVLLVVNAVEPSLIGEVQRLERATGLPVRYIVSPGGGHHLMMEPWHAAFTQAEILLPPARIPRTENGRKLLALPRVSLLDAQDPLPQFKGQLDFVLFDGLLSMRDHRSALEGAKENLGNMLKMMWAMMTVSDPVDELWLHHTASGTVVGGENLGWMFPQREFDKLPGMFKMMMAPEKVYVMKARKVGDRQRVAAHWARILNWPARVVMTYHDPPGHAFVGDGRAALREAAAAVKQLAAQ
jgi:hypothetical protein